MSGTRSASPRANSPCVSSPCSPSGSAVVAGEHHQRAALPAGRQQRAQLAQRGVGGGHLAVVGVARELGRERLRRLVGRVRIVEVHPGEGGPAVAVPHPLAGGGDGRGRGALGQQERRGRAAVREGVVVDVEPAVQPESRVQRERAHERAGAIAALLQARGQRGRARGEAEAGVVAHAVLERIAAREDVRVRRQGHDVVGVRALEPHALRRQPVDPGRPRPRVPVGAQRVRPQRVDGDQEDVEARFAADLPRPAGREEPRRRQRQDAGRQGQDGVDPDPRGTGATASAAAFADCAAPRSRSFRSVALLPMFVAHSYWTGPGALALRPRGRVRPTT